MKKLLAVLSCCSIFAIGCNNFENNNIIEPNEDNDESDIDSRYVLDLDEVDDLDIPKLRVPKDILIKQAKRELNENKNYSKALMLFNKILYEGIEQENSWIYSDIGKIQIKLGNIKEAIGSFTKAIELESKAEYYEARSEAYNLIGNKEFASADMAEAKKLGKDIIY